MKYFYALFLAFTFLCVNNPAEAGIKSPIKYHASHAPKQYSKDMNVLVDYLTKDLNDDYDKASAIAYWIASHVVYDEFYYRKGKPVNLRGSNSDCNEDFGDTFRIRAGTCGNYANLFVMMCNAAGVEAEVISGWATKQGGSLSSSGKKSGKYNHAWNSFKYKGKDILVDTTWMAGGTLPSHGGTSCSSRKYALRRWVWKVDTQNPTFDVEEKWFDFGNSYSLRKTHIEDKDDK